MYDLSQLTSGVDFVILTLTIIRRLRSRPRPRPARTSRPLRVQQDDEEKRAPARPPRRRHVRGITRHFRPSAHLSISFCSIMCFAEHLAVPDVCRPALRPRRHVVSVHLRKLIDPHSVRRMTDRTERTIRHAFLLRGDGLLRIDRLCLLRIEDTDVEKPRIFLAAKNVLSSFAAVTNGPE